MRSVWEIRVNFFPKEYFWGEHLYQPGKFPKGKIAGGNPTGDGVPCGVIQGCHYPDMSEWGLTIALETMAIARLGFKHSRVGSSELARSNFNRE